MLARVGRVGKIGRGAVRSSLWTPQSASNVALWLDADDPDTILRTAGAITSWTNKRGTGSAATPSASPPTVTANSQNGRPGISFGGTYFTGTITLSGGSFSAFAVMTMNSGSGGTGRFLSLANTGATDNAATGAPVIRRNGAGTQTVAFFYGGAAKTTNNITYDSAFLIGHVVSSGTISTRLAGDTESTSAASVSLTVARYALGVDLSAAGVGSTAWTGKIYELIIMSAAASTVDRQNIEGYLAWKWGLTSSLPTDHPYKSAAP